MAILILNTVEANSLVGLVDPATGAMISSDSWPTDRSLSEIILTKIEDLLSSAILSLSDLKGIVVFKGPGSFTSLRIGISVVNTIADQLEIPIVGSTGDNWLEDGLAELKLSRAGKIVLPEYGGEANITKQRK